METTTVTPEEVKERLINLDRRRRDAGAKQEDTKQKLQNERINLSYAESQRAELLPDLTHEDVAVNAWAQNELDTMDRDILARKRLIEALEGALAKVTAEVEQVNREWKALDEAVEAQERAERFQGWKADVERRYNTASDNLDAARTSLGELGITAREGREKCGPQADAWLTQMNETFFRKQMNLDVRGFVDRYDYNASQFTFVIKPQVLRKE